MPTIHCPNPQCNKSYNVVEENLGGRATCKVCGSVFELAVPQNSSPSTAKPMPKSRPIPVASVKMPDDPMAPLQPSEKVPEKLGRFQIRGLLGTGAFGTVYRAHDPVLDREVALKVPQSTSVQDEESAARFLREAKAAAHLTHPNIVPIYDAGLDGEHFFIASKFIEGQTLDAAIKSEQIDFRQASQIVRELADALDYAHGQGIVHRDIKPANIMLDSQNKPHLMDFGLARLASEREKLTHDGSILGTPSYMSPEQAGGESTTPVGPPSDQYSLGAVLYEMLCGERPFEGPVQVVIFNVLKTEPPTAGSLNPQVPKDLDTICQKAMAKEPGRRYLNCRALSEDLRRWQDDESIHARRVGPAERLVRWCRRNPAMAGLTGFTAVLLVAVAVISTVGYTITSEALSDAKSQKTLADRHRDRFDWLHYSMQIKLAQLLWNNGDKQSALQYLKNCRWDFRGWEHDYLYTSFTSDQENLTLKGHTNSANHVTFSPDGRRIASASNDKTVKVWDATAGQETLTLKGHTDFVRSVAFSPDGRRIVSNSGDGTIKVWDATTGEEKFSFRAHSSGNSREVFSPDGRKIVSSFSDGTIKVWAVSTGQETLRFNTHSLGLNHVVFSPDGRRIVSGSYDKSIKVWDAITGVEKLTIKLDKNTRSSHVVFSPDGQRIVSVPRWDGTVKVWDATTGEETLSFNAQSSEVNSVVFSPDGRRIVSGSTDGTIKVWEVSTGEETLSFNAHSSEVNSVAFSPDGRRIVSGSSDGAIKVWKATASQELTLQGHTKGITAVAFSANGQWIVSGSYDNTIRVWDAAKGDETSKISGPDDLRSVAISPDGRRILRRSYPDLKVWDATTGEELLTIKLDKNFYAGHLAFSPDGRQIACVANFRTIKVWNATTGKERLTIKADSNNSRNSNHILSWAFSPNGRQIFALCKTDKNFATFKMWNAITGEETIVIEGGYNLNSRMTCISPDWRRIVSSSFDSTTISVWDVATGNKILTLRKNSDGVNRLAFSSDGLQIIGYSSTFREWDKVVVWDAVTGAKISSELSGSNHDGRIKAFSPDGTRFVNVSDDDLVLKVWNEANASIKTSGNQDVSPTASSSK